MNFKPFFCALLLLSWFAQAGDGADFAVASRTEQATLLQQWAAAPQASRVPLLQALRNESLVIDQKKQPFSKQGDILTPLDSARQPSGDTKKLFMNNRLRVLIASALAAHQLVSDDAAIRLRAAQQLQNDAAADQLPLMEQRLAAEKDAQVHTALAMAVASLQLASPDAALRLKAVTLLGEGSDPNVQASLDRLTQASIEPDAQVRAAAVASLQHIKHRLMWGDLLGQAFTGLSLGSILLLAALGLAITYGLLGVINMAHGEMLMLGAYATWFVQHLFQQFAPQWLAWYPLLALPAAFLITAGIGMLLERAIIRHLYGRPLET
ncbi:MAG TPA: urea ABC transporter permease subunit UrtB, partial [Pantoea sp.]|nr:urea ABC transporter permease subunit UrtB [Pantoea sp.]